MDTELRSIYNPLRRLVQRTEQQHQYLRCLTSIAAVVFMLILLFTVLLVALRVCGIVAALRPWVIALVWFFILGTTFAAVATSLLRDRCEYQVRDLRALEADVLNLDIQESFGAENLHGLQRYVEDRLGALHLLRAYCVLRARVDT